MSLALWMLPAAALLPYVTVGVAKFGGGGSGYDNSRPRAWTERLAGWRQRAEWAHRNHFEAFPPFAAGVLAASIRHVSGGWIDLLAGGFVACRLGYTAAYVGDLPGTRSLAWALGLGCVVGLFLTAAAS